MFSVASLQRIVLILQGGLGIGGLAAAVFCLILLVTAPIQSISPTDLTIGGMVVGIVLMLTALIGALTTMRMTDSSPDDPGRSTTTISLVTYALLLAGLVGCTIGGLVILARSNSDSTIEAHLDRLWNTTNVSTALQIQTWGQCCGFRDYADRIQQPCTEYQQEVGCFEPMRSFYAQRLDLMWMPGLVLLIGECVGLLLALIILYLRYRDDQEAKLIGDRQPFDSWQKAVFQ